MAQTQAQLIDYGTAVASSVPTNGPYLSAANTVAISTNGAQRVTVNSSGNVGIATATPDEKLAVNGAIRVTSNATQFNASDGGVIDFNAGNTRIVAARSTAADGAIQFFTTSSGTVAEKARLTASGQWLVGTSSARANFYNSTVSSALQVEGTGSNTATASIVQCSNDSASGGLTIAKARGTTVGSNTIVVDGDALGLISFQGSDGSEFVEGARIQAFADGGVSANDLPTRLVFSTTADGAASPTERMRIDNAGRLFLNTTSTTPSQNALVGNVATGTLIASHENGNTGSNFATFYYNSTIIGAIAQTSTSSVSYNTSSDYRLKENISAVTDGISRLQQLKPSRFNFISDPDKIVDGFIAHEVQDVVPEAITGEKDAVDDDGNPIYQGIDQSKLVPLLTAALQEAIGEIESLKARVAALESA